ncbi:hypothetical protein X963_5516 [Burkholderia pseudomallei MSHR7498]|uniref:Uncharacterized protein n=2 Tax=Burkholderia pseudomallei TaxID=28450 RepID=A0A0E1VUH6_BURPE|nr:hypothetical protein BURPS668_A1158 [Burkholderia pseudomallei 668]ABN95180.1 hypothetical protein BURPS1106A_A1081 [Burkholderia pseudomallei 1106a]ABO01740.1 hypothetical protein BMA10247_A1786 [Burkholderia mallei NCTC 10247]AFR19033.1 hypothetical protein BPC006_II1105 [Burkholderia pseudomallei BPC006]EBA49816.1 hypothetical protein BURPS305_5342 [Burkholderia pseudomallei 305]EDK52054.1 hypothetical protein BMAFMH_I0107 [Burkholderia mallei FMH]EDK57359.1 hypothetical protein BMAJHU_
MSGRGARAGGARRPAAANGELANANGKRRVARPPRFIRRT